MDYNNLLISPENKIIENNILENVYRCIDSKKSFLYDTGAGAGKTYALKETLVYILKKYGKFLKKLNQNILCITYTNVAVNEIKERLGNTNIVLVSTIHERIWNIIKRFQNELKLLHKDKLQEELLSIKEFLEEDDKANWYKNIDKSSFDEILYSHIKEYYKNHRKNASNFRIDFIQQYFPNFNVTNISNFKSTIENLIRKKKYEETLSKIDQLTNKQIVYDPKYNNDKLEEFMISHDTLLDYAFKLISRYEKLQKILADKYPFIFVDEYQDTNEKIVKLINLIKNQSEKIGKNVCVGFFGDSKQSIYDDGIGSGIYELVEEYCKIKNNFNRRSCSEIVNYANKIRNDSISQISIFNNFHADNCKFFNESLDDNTIEEIKQDWNISINNKLHCFVLKNDIVAEKNLFKSVYEAFSSCTYFEQLNTELLSEDEFKLGGIELLFKRLIAFKNKSLNPKSLVYNFIDLKNKSYTVDDIKDVINKIKEVNGDILSDYSKSFFETFKDHKDIIKHVLKDNFIESFEDFKIKIAMVLFKNDENPNLDIFLNLKMDELNNWYKYITRDYEDKEVIYQTIHSSKGLQYDNVVIVLEDNFAKDHKYFSRFFENYDCENELDTDNKRKYLKAQNLLYVGFTRAIKNLFVFYNYDQSNKKLQNNIDRIFN